MAKQIMNKNEYVEHLRQKGYEILDENKVSLGSLIFNIRENIAHTAMGKQSTFCLKLSPESNTSLCPSPWH